MKNIFEAMLMYEFDVLVLKRAKIGTPTIVGYETNNCRV